MLNFGASKPRVKGGAQAPLAPPGSAPVTSGIASTAFTVANILQKVNKETHSLA